MAGRDLEALVSGLGGWVAELARRARQLVVLVATLAGLAGAVALVLGVLAWHDSVSDVALVLLLTVPAVLAPLYVAWRVRPITEAVERPDELARQARAYFAGLQRSPELDELVSRATTAPDRGRRFGVGNVWRSSRLLGTLLSRIAPDTATQPLLAALQPTRLRAVWLGVVLSWWSWVVALVVLVAAVLSLTVDAIS